MTQVAVPQYSDDSELMKSPGPCRSKWHLVENTSVKVNG